LINQIALIQIMIHHLTGREVVIRIPTTFEHKAKLNLLHERAMIWSKAVNLKHV